MRSLKRLEMRYLANRDDNLHFALLTDSADAATEARCRTTPRYLRRPRTAIERAQREAMRRRCR